MKTIYYILAGLLLTIPAALAAPDTAPPLEWDVDIPQVPGSTCTIQRHLVDLTTDTNGNAYLLQNCQLTTGAGTTNVPIISKYTSGGAHVWDHAVHCPNDASCLPYGIAVDSAGYLGISYYDAGAVSAVKQFFRLIKQSDGSTACVTGPSTVFPNGFTQDIAALGTLARARSVVALKNVNATTIYIIGGGAGSDAVIINTATDCRQLWTGTVAGEYGVTYNAVTSRATLVSGGPVVKNVNVFTGALTATMASPISFGEHFRNATGRSLYTSIYGTSITLREYNSTTLALIRAITPIENKVYSGATPLDTYAGTAGTGQHYGMGIVDGGNSMFVCGLLQPTAPHAGKYNLTAVPGQRWNVTWASDSINGGYARQCEIAPGGGLYVTWDDDNGGLSPFKMHLRKYTNAGTPPARDVAYMISGGVVVGGSGGGASCASGNIIQCIRQNASDAWGFDWGWLIGGIIVGIFVWKVHDAKVIVIAIMAFLGLGLAVAVGMLPEWILYVVVFIIIATGGVILFGGRGEEDSE